MEKISVSHFKKRYHISKNRYHISKTGITFQKTGITFQKTGITFQNNLQRTFKNNLQRAFNTFCPRKWAKSKTLKTWDGSSLKSDIRSIIKVSFDEQCQCGKGSQIFLENPVGLTRYSEIWRVQ